MKKLKGQQESNRLYQERRRRKLGVLTREQTRTNNEASFIQNSQEVHKNKYTYFNVLYKRNDTKVEISCPTHGSFFQTPSAHLHSSQGCPLCAHEARVCSRKRKTTKEFITEANKKHNNQYSYQRTTYVRIKDKVIITCGAHGEFTQTAKAHLMGQGCPSCANVNRARFYESKGERKIEKFLIENGVVFEKQKTFDRCKHKMLLRYDFYLPKVNTLIEFDGEQHYKFVPKFHGDELGYKIQQTRDMIKTKYAEDNDILLVRIKWNQEDNIIDILQRVIQ